MPWRHVLQVTALNDSADNWLLYRILASVVRDWWSDVLRSSEDGIGMIVGLELSQPARQCDGKPTESDGSKLARLWGLNRYG